MAFTPQAYLLHLDDCVEVRVTKQLPQSLRAATRRRCPGASVVHVTTEEIAEIRAANGLLIGRTQLGDVLIEEYDKALQEERMR